MTFKCIDSSGHSLEKVLLSNKLTVYMSQESLYQNQSISLGKPIHKGTRYSTRTQLQQQHYLLHHCIPVNYHSVAAAVSVTERFRDPPPLPPTGQTWLLIDSYLQVIIAECEMSKHASMT